MTTLSIPNNIANEQALDATPVDQNFDAIATHVNAELVNRDGTIAMTGQLSLGAGDPVADGDAARKAYVDTFSKGEVGYAQVVANLSAVAATATSDLTGLSVTFTAVAGRRYKATAWVAVDPAVGISETADVVLSIREGTTELSSNGRAITNVAAQTMDVLYVSNASIAGSKTWKVSLQTSVGTVTPTASATRPAFILVEDIGTV
jgi:hypothetical protein